MNNPASCSYCDYVKTITAWVTRPFSLNMSVWGWIIFISLISIVAYSWRGAITKLLTAIDL